MTIGNGEPLLKWKLINQLIQWKIRNMNEFQKLGLLFHNHGSERLLYLKAKRSSGGIQMDSDGGIQMQWNSSRNGIESYRNWPSYRIHGFSRGERNASWMPDPQLGRSYNSYIKNWWKLIKHWRMNTFLGSKRCCRDNFPLWLITKLPERFL